MGTTRLWGLVAAAALSAACQAPVADTAPAGPDVAVVVAPESAAPPAQETAPESAAPDLRSDPELQTGIMLRSPEGRRWGLRLAFPAAVGLTDFDLKTGFSYDNVTTVSVVPTLEFIVPINDSWTVLPYFGFGAAGAVGDHKPVSGENLLSVVSTGMRLQRWRPFGERYVSVIAAEVGYDAVLAGRNGLLGDWGSVTAAVELRRAFGPPRAGPCFQAGLYAQGFWFWDPVELEVEGIAPHFLHNQREFGISLGGSTPYKLWGLNVPRVFIGVRIGEDVRILRVRFGRL